MEPGDRRAGRAGARPRPDRDAVSVGDHHLAGIIGRTLGGQPLTDAELLPFVERWRPHRYRVARLLHASGIETLPRGVS